MPRSYGHYVTKRGGWWYVRVVVPEQLRHLVGLTEIRRSLKTSDRKLGSLRALEQAIALHQEWQQMAIAALVKMAPDGTIEVESAFLMHPSVAECGVIGRPGPSNDLLIVGYDREPDTLNRFSTHILEDIQTCVVEGLTTTDERMQVVPLLATVVPTIENGGVHLRPDGGMDVVWTLQPGVTMQAGPGDSRNDRTGQASPRRHRRHYHRERSAVGVHRRAENVGIAWERISRRGLGIKRRMRRCGMLWADLACGGLG
jgi:hypothetical protein